MAGTWTRERPETVRNQGLNGVMRGIRIPPSPPPELRESHSHCASAEISAPPGADNHSLLSLVSTPSRDMAGTWPRPFAPRPRPSLPPLGGSETFAKIAAGLSPFFLSGPPREELQAYRVAMPGLGSEEGRTPLVFPGREGIPFPGLAGRLAGYEHARGASRRPGSVFLNLIRPGFGRMTPRVPGGDPGHGRTPPESTGHLNAGCNAPGPNRVYARVKVEGVTAGRDPHPFNPAPSTLLGRPPIEWRAR